MRTTVRERSVEVRVAAVARRGEPEQSADARRIADKKAVCARLRCKLTVALRSVATETSERAKSPPLLARRSHLARSSQVLLHQAIAGKR